MEFKLNEDQQMIHDLAKDFAESVLQPRIDEIEAGEMTEVSNGQKHPQLPHDIHQQLAECGFIGISFPEEYNGMGMGHVEQAIVIKELSRVSPSVGKCLDVYILGLEALDLYANHEQKMKYLAPCCSGEQTVSFAFTEPETGSDPKMLKTRLEKQADGTYKLNGVKRFISNAGYDGPCVLFALQKDEESGKDLVTGLVIDKFCEGYSISSPWEKIGYRGSEVYDIFLDDVKVTEDQILGKPGDGFTQLLGTTTLNADQKLDEQRLQLKLAAAEAREAAPKKRALRETLAAVRAKTEEAREAAKRASEIAKLNTAEAAKAAQLAAKGTMERAAELLRLEQLAEELQARSDEMQAQLLRTPRIVGPRRMLRAFPGLKHGVKKTTLKALRLGLARRESPEEEPKKNGSDTRKDA